MTGVNRPRPGYVGIAVAVDSRLSPGNILRPKDRVNICGQVNGEARRIITGVRVLAVGGLGDDRNEGRRITGPKSPTTYRSVTVELAKDVSLQWANIQSHVNGDCWVEVLSPTEKPTPEFGKIADDLKGLGKGSAKPAAAEGPMGSGGGPGAGSGIGGSKLYE